MKLKSVQMSKTKNEDNLVTWEFCRMLKNVNGSILAFLSFPPPRFERDHQLACVAFYIENHKAHSQHRILSHWLMESNSSGFPHCRSTARPGWSWWWLPSISPYTHPPPCYRKTCPVETVKVKCWGLWQSCTWNMDCPRPSGFWYPIIKSQIRSGHTKPNKRNSQRQNVIENI